jgi:hypothetical protein
METKSKELENKKLVQMLMLLALPEKIINNILCLLRIADSQNLLFLTFILRQFAKINSFF